MSFDFSDPKIRAMVEANHEPEEVWRHAGNRIADYLQLIEIRCVKCHHSWPCPTIRELRAWRKGQERGKDPVVVVGL